MSEPHPHSQPRNYGPITWPEGTRTQLAPRSGQLQIDLAELLEQRQTRREFTADVSDEQLGQFLWLACRSRSSRPGPFGTPQESRPHPSAGGMHPIHIVLARLGRTWQRYDPAQHALVEVPGGAESAAAARLAAGELVPLGRGVLVGLLAEWGKTAAKYENPESLVWRDAGAVLGYMSVVAEALGMNFCPLGLTGDVHLRAILPSEGRLLGAGLAILGRT